MDFKKESGMLKAIAHPVRLRMVEGLCENECSVTKIVSILKLPQSTVSQHLSVLRNNGIIEPRKEGVRTCYRVVSKKVKSLISILGTK